MTLEQYAQEYIDKNVALFREKGAQMTQDESGQLRFVSEEQFTAVAIALAAALTRDGIHSDQGEAAWQALLKYIPSGVNPDKHMMLFIPLE